MTSTTTTETIATDKTTGLVLVRREYSAHSLAQRQPEAYTHYFTVIYPDHSNAGRGRLTDTGGVMARARRMLRIAVESELEANPIA